MVGEEAMDLGRVPGAPGSREPSPKGLGPSGFDPSRAWPLHSRHQRLPKWARLEIADLLCAQINSEMAPDVRGVARAVCGGNCTFSDDDLSLLACLAVAAIDAGLHHVIQDKQIIANIERAKAERDSDGRA